jgi:hypothetical protein
VKSFHPNRPRTVLEPSLAGVLDEEAWDRYVEYRKQIRKPIKPVSMLAAQRRLAGFGADQKAVVEQAIACGWIRLDAVKGTKPAPAGGPRREQVPTEAEVLEARLKLLEGSARAAGIEGRRADEPLELFEHRVGCAQLDALERGRKKGAA